MSTFQSFKQGRFHIHVLPTEQFRTRHLSVKIAIPARRETVTATAVLPFLWMEGTKRYPSAHALMRRADELFGTVLRTSTGKRGERQIAEVYASVPEEIGIDMVVGVFDQAKALLSDVFLHPFVKDAAFPDTHVAREKQLHRKRIDSVFDDKMAFAMERCMAEVSRGNDAASLPRFGFKEDIEQLTGASLYDVHRSLLREAEVHVYLVGNVSKEAAKQYMAELAEQVAGQSGDVQARRIAEQPLPLTDRAVQYVVDRHSISQGKLNLGFRTGVSYSSPDYAAMQMAVAILGGFPHSKLFVNVREKASLAYYASSRFDGVSGVTAVQTGIEIGKYQEALDIVLQQVDALKAGSISNDEFIFTKRGLLNQFKQALDQPMAMVDVHFTGILTGISQDVIDLMRGIQEVKMEDVVGAAEKLALDTVYFLRDDEVNADA